IMKTRHLIAALTLVLAVLVLNVLLLGSTAYAVKAAKCSAEASNGNCTVSCSCSSGGTCTAEGNCVYCYCTGGGNVSGCCN
ncbi:MAG: hypothetical protein ACPL7O_12680, partial [Armatimonadota bacterium]